MSPCLGTMMAVLVRVKRVFVEWVSASTIINTRVGLVIGRCCEGRVHPGSKLLFNLDNGV